MSARVAQIGTLVSLLCACTGQIDVGGGADARPEPAAPDARPGSPDGAPDETPRTPPADWPVPASDLEQRRRAVLASAAQVQLAGQVAGYPQPNVKLTYGWAEHDYQQAALALLALADLGDDPAGRRDLANRLLRYQLLGEWPADTTADLIGQYPKAWNHRARPLGVRICALHRAALEPDLRAECDQRLEAMVTEVWTTKSVNIKFTNNASIYLAHELTGRTGASSFAAVRTWIVDNLRSVAVHGNSEWGSGLYSGWTLGAILNLADLAADAEVEALATMALDYHFARLAGFTHRGVSATTGVRRYGHQIMGAITPDTSAAQTLFWGGTEDDTWVEFAASAYRPLRLVAWLYYDPDPREANITEAGRFHHRAWRARDVLIGTQQQPSQEDYFGSPGETHDPLSVTILSTAGGRRRITSLGIPMHVAKYRSRADASFGYGPVAFYNGGGYTKKAWSGGVQTGVPIRLFHDRAFTAELEGGWAFLTDGVIYAAWAPSVGDPIHDPQSAELLDPDKVGRLLVSTHTPPDGGESCVIEIGDGSTHADYAAFKADILARNPRPRWAEGALTYQAPDGTMLEWRPGQARVDGVPFDPATHPRAAFPGLDGFTVTVGDESLTFDFAAGAINGSADRI